MRTKLMYLAPILGMTMLAFGCDYLIPSPTEPDTIIEVHDNQGEVNIDVSDDDVTIDTGDGNGDAEIDQSEETCDTCEGETTCYSIPSGGERSCSGCTIGVDCTLTNPEDEEE